MFIQQVYIQHCQVRFGKVLSEEGYRGDQTTSPTLQGLKPGDVSKAMCTEVSTTQRPQTMRDTESVFGEGRDRMPWDPANQGAASKLSVGDIIGTVW